MKINLASLRKFESIWKSDEMDGVIFFFGMS